MDDRQLREQICQIGQRIQSNNFVAANDGNITVKVSENEYYTTPTGVSKGYMTPDMVCRVDASGAPLDDNKWKPSSEVKVHLQVYKHRPDVGSVIHTHPPFATIYAILGKPLDQYLLPESILSIGAVPIVPYAIPSSVELAEALIPFLDTYDAFLLENHGLVTVGPDLQTAYFKTETVEFYSKITYHLELLGKTRELPMAEIDRLMEMRERIKLPGNHPGYKKF